MNSQAVRSDAFVRSLHESSAGTYKRLIIERAPFSTVPSSYKVTHSGTWDAYCIRYSTETLRFRARFLGALPETAPNALLPSSDRRPHASARKSQERGVTNTTRLSGVVSTRDQPRPRTERCHKEPSSGDTVSALDVVGDKGTERKENARTANLLARTAVQFVEYQPCKKVQPPAERRVRPSRPLRRLPRKIVLVLSVRIMKDWERRQMAGVPSTCCGYQDGNEAITVTITKICAPCPVEGSNREEEALRARLSVFSNGRVPEGCCRY